jgi:hypothetical protein
MNDRKRKETVEKLVERFVESSKRNGQQITESAAREMALRAEKINRRNQQ